MQSVKFASGKRLKEIHIDDPHEDTQFGGDEPISDDETGKDQHVSSSMTMENLRSMIRTILREEFDDERELAPDEKLLSRWTKADDVDRALHRDNFLMRPSTGDMVVVNPGTFVRARRRI